MTRGAARMTTAGTGAFSTEEARVAREAMALAMEATLNRPSLGPEPRDLAVPAGMRRVRFPAMGTSVSLLLPAGQAEAAGAEVRGLFELWERTLSRFQPQSE